MTNNSVSVSVVALFSLLSIQAAVDAGISDSCSYCSWPVVISRLVKRPVSLIRAEKIHTAENTTELVPLLKVDAYWSNCVA